MIAFQWLPLLSLAARASIEIAHEFDGTKVDERGLA
jgi:hypothetical protein